jgi:hypothetical protein
MTRRKLRITLEMSISDSSGMGHCGGLSGMKHVKYLKIWVRNKRMRCALNARRALCLSWSPFFVQAAELLNHPTWKFSSSIFWFSARDNLISPETSCEFKWYLDDSIIYQFDVPVCIVLHTLFSSWWVMVHVRTQWLERDGNSWNTESANGSTARLPLWVAEGMTP